MLIAGVVLHPATGAAEDSAPTIAAGAGYIAPFKQRLKQALQDGLAHGPFTAIDACKVDAPEIAESLSTDEIRLGRSSHRLRNPENKSPEWVKPLLSAYLKVENDRAPRTISLPGDRIGYVEPIILQPMCLVCHGESLAPDVDSQISVLYPDDEATGFKVGDLRGVFWVEYPAAPVPR